MDLTVTENRTTSWTTERQCENEGMAMKRARKGKNDQKKRCVVEGANSEHVALCLGDGVTECSTYHSTLGEVSLAMLL